MKLAVIPARGGSKRIPRKNIRPFCGRPIIAYSIETAKRSGCFDRIVVSTDDPEIAEVARRYGAEVPFLRPVELADHFCGTNAVVRHAIEWFRERGEPFEYTCCIYATAPFIREEDIQEGLRVLLQSKSDYSFAVTSYPFPIQRALRITKEGGVEMFDPERFSARSQDLEEAYHDAGQFYWGRAGAWLAGTPVFSQGAIPIILPRYRVEDIDTLEDWVRAEWLFKALKVGE